MSSTTFPSEPWPEWIIAKMSVKMPMNQSYMGKVIIAFVIGRLLVGAGAAVEAGEKRRVRRRLESLERGVRAVDHGIFWVGLVVDWRFLLVVKRPASFFAHEDCDDCADHCDSGVGPPGKAKGSH